MTQPERIEDSKEATSGKASYTAYRREKKTRRSVLIADALADRSIMVGGILVIIAVLGILVFLVSETLPLFHGGKLQAQRHYRLELPAGSMLSAAMDEYKTLAFFLSSKGQVVLVHARTGHPLKAPVPVFQGQDVTAYAETIEGGHLALGFADGTLRFARIRFDTEIVSPGRLPADLGQLDERDSTDGTAVYSRIPGNQFRRIALGLEVEDPVAVSEAGKRLVALDYRVSGEAERQARAFVAVDEGGRITYSLGKSRIHLLTGKQRIEERRVQLPALPEGVSVQSVLLSEKSDAVFVTDRSGVIYRYNTSDLDAPRLAEISRPLPEGTAIQVLGFLIGGQSLVLGGADGSLRICFLLKQEDAETADRLRLVPARSFPLRQSAVVLLEPGARGKTFAVADRSGLIEVLHGTSQKTLMRFPDDSPNAPYRILRLAPRMDGLLAFKADGRVNLWEYSVPHPETTFRTLFGKVWYEGYPEPTYTWQSSAATDDWESKFSLIPLIFGTLKGAFYSLLFAIPIGVLGAIYTSEFLHPRVRGVVKPAMELMASLPSVVLGFVAALVLAPVIETWIGAVVLAFVIVPGTLILAAYLWQLLPLELGIRLQGVPRFLLMMLAVLIGTYVTASLGPLLERWLFDGDFKAWLNGDLGGAQPFLFLLALPLSFVFVGMLFARVFGRRFSLLMKRVTHFQAGLLDAVRWLAMILAAAASAWGLADFLALIGVDLRGSLVDTYVQRNTLVVGFAMGFAVIPIIYTIAEDALNAVPEHLRAASLGCGATPWQTAIYVVLPTALSGVFSAIMIGMGRAVGETMIVVMAAGNTPLLDWNVFNGLRALSATIAVELPEAVKDGTLYRILFFSGLVLFAMTFVINTIAEMVRLRFRKRTTQL